MEKPTGTVVELLHAAGGRRVAVEVDGAAACARCAAGNGCGAGLLLGTGRARRFEARVSGRVDLAIGDRVQLKFAPRSLLGAAVQAYGAPLIGAVSAAAAAHGMAFGDAGAAAACLAGMAAGSLASRHYLNRPSCVARFEPRIEKLL